MKLGDRVRLISIAEFHAQCKQANLGEHLHVALCTVARA